MGCHPTAVCDQAGDQHEEEVPSCCGCVWIFHVTEVPDSVKIIKCKNGQYVLLFSYPMHKATQNESEYQQKNIAGDFGKFFWAATHTVSCVAHSTNARSLQVVSRCKGD